MVKSAEQNLPSDCEAGKDVEHATVATGRMVTKGENLVKMQITRTQKYVLKPKLMHVGFDHSHGDPRICSHVEARRGSRHDQTLTYAGTLLEKTPFLTVQRTV